MVVAQVLTAALGIAALVLALVIFVGKTSEINQSRVDSRYDSCYLLRTLVLTATVPARRAATEQFLAHSELANCTTYSHQLGAS